MKMLRSHKCKKVIGLIITIVIITALIVGGLRYLAVHTKYTQFAYVNYSVLLNSSKVLNAFETHNITYYLDVSSTQNGYTEWYRFSFGKGINNDSIPNTCGNIFFSTTQEPGFIPTGIHLRLNESEYPEVKDLNIYKQREPLLEKSMNYIVEIIYEATGQLPCTKRILIEDSYI